MKSFFQIVMAYQVKCQLLPWVLGHTKPHPCNFQWRSWWGLACQLWFVLPH